MRAREAVLVQAMSPATCTSARHVQDCTLQVHMGPSGGDDPNVSACYALGPLACCVLFPRRDAMNSGVRGDSIRPRKKPMSDQPLIAYFSMEIELEVEIPTYSGRLDPADACCDSLQRVPMVVP